jgi:hypothetical protein
MSFGRQEIESDAFAEKKSGAGGPQTDFSYAVRNDSSILLRRHNDYISVMLKYMLAPIFAAL